MTLTDVLHSVKNQVKKARDVFIVPGSEKGLTNCSIDNYVKTTNQDYESVREYISQKKDEYENSFISTMLSAANGLGWFALLNSSYHTIQGTPYDDFGMLQLGLVSAKAVFELPEVYRLARAKNIGNTAEWALMKAAAFYLPVLGPLADLNTGNRIQRKNIAKQSAKMYDKCC